MLLKLNHLLLEVTRKCNMSCRHCMRGNAENVSLDYTVIDRIFQDTRYIGHLCLTGGEPSLEPYVIREILYRARRWDCRIGSFFCAANAKVYSPEFANTLTELYFYCTDKDKCTLTVTTDQFHESADPEALKSYRKLPYYRPVYEHKQIAPYFILDEGRAKENKIGRSEIPIKGSLYDISFHGFDFTCGDTVYINAKGDVLLNADLSYKNQNEFRIGNLLEDDLPHILLTAMYSCRFSRGEQVFRISCMADAGTIAPVKIEDERYYGKESAALDAYHQIIHNLHITPVNPEMGNVPENLSLAVESLPRNELSENRLAETKITYTANGKARFVRLFVKRFPLEDTRHE